MARISKELIKQAKENGISYRTLYSRLKELYWDKERAVSEPAKMGARKLFTPDEIEVAKSNGVSYKQLYNRVQNYGWEVEEAINRPLKGGGVHT